MSTAKKVIIAIFIVVISTIGILYIKFNSLDVYEWKGNIVVKDGIEFQDSSELFGRYLDGEIKTEKTIGRFKGDKFWGFKTWVVKFEGIDENDAFLLRGLMFEGVFSKKTSNCEID